ncbi:MAG: tRNA lysidine(34) synthetase TilS [Lautropia sp.]|nr:tRNA lysidine(34) synthetase TilS [Lautropia sp.]
MPLTALQQCLARAGHGPGDTLLLACSGGRDSQVLLHAAAALWPARQLVVAHVHHGLQGGADDWLDFCAAQAAALGLPFLHRRLPPTLMPDGRLANVESRAREGRYRALAEMAEVAGARMVLTAHHANDQLETIEIRRRRGSGVLGLAGMREQAPLPHAPAGYRLLRPFLGLGRAALAEWAAQQGIRWMDDPSNLDPRFTRNRVRRLLDQQLAGDQQALAQGLAEVGLLQQAADRMLRQAEADMQAASLHLLPATADIADGQNTARRADAALPALSRAALMRLGPARRAEALRYWLGLAGCRMPSRHKLDELERQLLLAASAQAIVHHDGCGLLRHRDRIGRLPPRVPVQPLWWRWQGESSLDTEAGRLHIEQVAMPPPWQQGQQLEGAGRSDRTHGSAGEVLLPVAMLSGVELMLDRGRGRDRLRLHPAAPSRSWKNLMQERGVPPCLRASLPVLRAGGHILFAAPFGVTVPAAPATGEAPNLPCVRLRWQPLPGVADWL